MKTRALVLLFSFGFFLSGCGSPVSEPIQSAPPANQNTLPANTNQQTIQQLSPTPAPAPIAMETFKGSAPTVFKVYDFNIGYSNIQSGNSDYEITLGPNGRPMINLVLGKEIQVGDTNTITMPNGSTGTITITNIFSSDDGFGVAEGHGTMSVSSGNSSIVCDIELYKEWKRIDKNTLLYGEAIAVTSKDESIYIALGTWDGKDAYHFNLTK